MTYETLLYATRDGIATITLNRADKMNAFTATMGREIVDAFRTAERDPDVRVVILTGAGKAFCAGADIAGFASEIKARETPQERSRNAREGREMLEFASGARDGQAVNRGDQRLCPRDRDYDGAAVRYPADGGRGQGGLYFCAGGADG